MNIVPTDPWSFIWGAVLGVLAAFSAGFLKRAGEDCYLWLRKKVGLAAAVTPSTQVIVPVPELMKTLAQSEIEVVGRNAPSITIQDIRKAIKNAPPLQRETVANSFVGIRVEWDAFLTGGSVKHDIASLRMSSLRESGMGEVRCAIPLGDYRELGILHEGARIRVNGVIEEVGALGWDVKLGDVTLLVLER